MQETSKCPICGLDAEGKIADFARSIEAIKCQRCGRYRAAEEALEAIERLGETERARLSIATRRASEGEKPLELQSDGIAELAARKELPVSRKARLLLEFLAERSEGGIGLPAKVHTRHDFPAIEATSPEELEQFLHYLESQGWVDEPAQGMGFERSFILTLDGWAELERPGEDGIVRNRVFIALSFNEEMNEPYANGIKAGIKDCHCDPRCLKDIVHTEDINNKILAEIALAEFVVADVTHHSNGVYFEAGYAMALGRPVVFTCNSDHKADCHFDTAHYPHLFWKTPEELREKLAGWLGALIGRRPPGGRASSVG